MSFWLPRTTFTRRLWPALRLRSGICCELNRKFTCSIPFPTWGASHSHTCDIHASNLYAKEADLSSHLCENEAELRFACRLLKRAVECLCALDGFWLSWFCFCIEASQMRAFWVYLLLRNSFPYTWLISISRERVDQVVREKEKLRSDLDKAEKLKSLIASEVDDHHAAIERRNEYNLRCDGRARSLLSHHPGPGQWGSASLPASLATPGWNDLGVAKPEGKQDSLDTLIKEFPISVTLCFHSWWTHIGISEGFGGSLSVFLPHRKLDEEYKERIAALKNELRKEREQILQQVGKQRLELEQEIEKAKTEENYIRDRLALSLKVIIQLVLWSVSLLGIPHGKPQVCPGFLGLPGWVMTQTW